MEIETEDTTEGEGVEGDQGKSAVETEKSGEGGKKSRPVNVAVSHAGLTENLKPLKATNVNIHIRAQETGGPRKTADKALKDLTNKSTCHLLQKPLGP